MVANVAAAVSVHGGRRESKEVGTFLWGGGKGYGLCQVLWNRKPQADVACLL